MIEERSLEGYFKQLSNVWSTGVGWRLFCEAEKWSAKKTAIKYGADLWEKLIEPCAICFSPY